MRGSWRPNRTAIYWPPPLLWLSALCLSRSLGLLNRRPRGSALCWVMAFFTASYQQLLWTSTQSGAPRAPSAWRGFPYRISSVTPTVLFLSSQSYIIVQHPLNLPLNPWNGMFDRHQAEISVMQFTGHSLPVHHSEVGPSPCPILSAELTCATAIGMCHFLPVHHFEWHFWPGRRSKYNAYRASMIESLIFTTAKLFSSPETILPCLPYQTTFVPVLRRSCPAYSNKQRSFQSWEDPDLSVPTDTNPDHTQLDDGTNKSLPGLYVCQHIIFVKTKIDVSLNFPSSCFSPHFLSCYHISYRSLVGSTSLTTLQQTKTPLLCFPF